ncbi:MAG: copper homeostasis membrane protein CopD [Xanthobacteraceae bacterium]|nr:copper homeostasis membrane protein CopD [Xanthobacteraceae bacterium]
MIDLGLILSRFLHYAAVSTLAGASFFPLYAYGATELNELFRWRYVVLFSAAVVAFLTGILWFIFSVANMSGSLADLVDREVIWTVVQGTGFGRVWIGRLALSVVIVGLFWTGTVARFDPKRDLITPVLAAVLLISLAGVGHSQIEEGAAGAVHVLSDAAHLLAAGAWLGGLVPLGHILLLHGRESGPAQRSKLNEILRRFSGMGYVAVATLLGSGLVNSWFLVGAVSGLFATAYGQLLIVKLGLFAGMLALAVLNRFWLVPSLTEGREDDGSGKTTWVEKLRYHVLSEQFLGLAVLLVVSVLGTMQPATGQ